MKNKIGLKSRIVISFSIFIILTINLFTYLLYIFIERNFINNIYKNIYNEYETITTFIDLQNDDLFSLPDYEVRKINSLNFFFYIGNDEKKLESINLGFTNKKNKEVIFRGVFKGTNIIIGKKIDDLNNIQKDFIEWTIFLNVFTVIFTILISYFLTTRLLNPLIRLSKFLDNYDINKEQKFIKNNYGDTEIGRFTHTLNKFISKIKSIFDSQKEFIRDVSHELKTPLMQIESSLELLENKITDKENTKRIENIKEGVENINNIISKLGFILRGEEILVKKESIDMGDYLTNLINNFRDKATEKNITIKLEKTGILNIENNKYYLDRLFGNIISNAIFYNKGNNEIKIIVLSDEIQIIDKGIGIEKTDLEKIFNRFYRNSDSGLYYKNGNGLGLTIAKKICDIFGWKIEIESEVGKGSIFRVKMK